jgi:hypothetical protein
MAIISIKSHLDGFVLPVYTTQFPVLAIEATVVKLNPADAVVFNCWVEDPNKEVFSLAKDIPLGANPYRIPLGGRSLGAGDTLIIQALATGNPDIVADLGVTLYSEEVSESITVPHLVGRSAFSENVGCGICSTGGKIIEFPKYMAGKEYTFQVDLGTALNNDNVKTQPLKVYYWSVPFVCPPTTAAEPWAGINRIIDLDISSGKSSFKFTIPTANFFGIGLLAFNAASAKHRITCCTWDKALRKIRAVAF